MKWKCLVLLSLLLLVFLPQGLLGAADADISLTAQPCSAAAPNVTASNATGITFVGATLHGNVTYYCGGNISTRGFEWGLNSGNYSWNWTESDAFGEGVFSHAVNNLTPATQYFWRAFASNYVGRGNSTELSFNTSNLLLPPTNLAITRIGGGSVNITWTMGVGADTTYIRGSNDGFPNGLSGGYLVYSGNGTSVVVDGLDLSMGGFFVTAWSENGGLYSDDYAQASIGGNMALLLGLLILCMFLMVMAYRTRDILVCTLSFFSWFGLGLWLFFSNSGFFNLADSHAQVFAYVFMGLAFVPMIWSMNRSIRFESSGQEERKAWEEEGTPSQGVGRPPTEIDKYRENRERIRKRLSR